MCSASRPIWEEVQKQHPDAYFKLTVPIGDIWSLPEEPHLDQWFRAPQSLGAHSERVRCELEAFLNKRLKGLCGAVRSGRWILGRVRV